MHGVSWYLAATFPEVFLSVLVRDEVDEFERKHSRKLVCNEIESCAVCDFAKKCSAFRQSGKRCFRIEMPSAQWPGTACFGSAVKHDMRLRGSYLMHAILIVRDAWEICLFVSRCTKPTAELRASRFLRRAASITGWSLVGVLSTGVPPSPRCVALTGALVILRTSLRERTKACDRRMSSTTCTRGS